MPPLRNANEASVYLRTKGVKISPKTLGKYRVIGGGPAFRYFGRTPLYEDAALDSWVEGKLSSARFSTSEAA